MFSGVSFCALPQISNLIRDALKRLDPHDDADSDAEGPFVSVKVALAAMDAELRARISHALGGKSLEELVEGHRNDMPGFQVMRIKRVKERCFHGDDCCYRVIPQWLSSAHTEVPISRPNEEPGMPGDFFILCPLRLSQTLDGAARVGGTGAAVSAAGNAAGSGRSASLRPSA